MRKKRGGGGSSTERHTCQARERGARICGEGDARRPLPHSTLYSCVQHSKHRAQGRADAHNTTNTRMKAVTSAHTHTHGSLKRRSPAERVLSVFTCVCVPFSPLPLSTSFSISHRACSCLTCVLVLLPAGAQVCVSGYSIRVAEKLVE